MSGIFKKTLKAVTILICFILLLIIILFVFIQTQAFNKYALEYTLNELNLSQHQRQNNINAESIEGNVLSGIRFNKGSITIREDTLLSFDYLEVKYSLWGLLDKRILVHDVVLREPVIRISRIDSGDSLIWNFENLFGPPETDTTPAEPFDWDVAVENLKIENGFVRIIGDSLKPEARWKSERCKMHFFDFNQTDVFNLNVELNAKYYSDFKSISINNISFNTNSEFNLRKLHFNANLNEKDTTFELWNFEAVTDKSDLNIYHLSAENFNPIRDFVYEELGDKNIKASIDIEKFNFDDLAFFIPEVNFLDSVVGVKIEAEGKFRDLNAQTFEVRLPNSVINLKGKVVNLQKPDSIYLDVDGKNITIDAKDIKRVYKGGIDDFGHIGMVNADLHYKGTLRDFSSDFALSTQFGIAEGSFNYNTENTAYSGDINTHRLNLGRILRNNSLNGGLNLSARFDGEGFKLNKMSTNIVYSVSSSRIGKYDVRNSSGIINTNNGNIKLNVKLASSMGNADVNGQVNVSNTNKPEYNLQGRVEGLDVSAITGNPEDKSNLNASFKVNGSGRSMHNINGSYKLDVMNSYYGKYQIPSTPVDVEIKTNNTYSKVSIVTDMADFNAEGSFKIGEIVDAVLYNLAQVQNQLIESTGTKKLLSNSANSQIVIFKDENVSFGDFNLTYTLASKDSVKLNRILEPFGIIFDGDVSGELSNSARKFTSLTKLDVKNFSYIDTVVAVRNLKTYFVFNNEYTNSLNGLDIKLNTGAEELSFGANRVDSINAVFNINTNNADFKLIAAIDSTAKVNINGNLNFGSGKFDAEFDSVFVDYRGYQLENSGRWILAFEEGDRIKFRQFDIKSRNAIMNVNGEFSFQNESDLKIEGNNLKITDIGDILKKADSTYILSAKNHIEGEVDKLYLSYKGTFNEPIVNAEMKTSMLRYNETDIGKITSVMNYETNTAKVDIVMNNAKGEGKLTLKGTIPFTNPFSANSLSATQVTSEPVDISLKADNFSLDYFGALMSNVQSLKGILNADLSAKGTEVDPLLSGNLKITNGGYLLPLTGMYYSFNVDMSTDNFKLILNRLRLYNEDDESKHIDIYGKLDFNDMKITEIDLEAKGSMVLLNKDVEHNDLGVYGFIYAGIGNPSIKIKGSSDSLFITGRLLVKEATISSVPIEGSGYNISNDNFIYIDSDISDSLSRIYTSAKNTQFDPKLDSVRFVVDSVKYVGDSLIITLEEYNLLNPFERMRYKVSDEAEKQRFINLDVNIKTEQDIYASMDFNNLTKDRLFGELKADLDIKTEDGKLKAYGTVDVDRDSYYRFYRDFKLDNSRIKFEGDLTNPKLDVRGVYASQKNNEQLGSVTTSEVEVVVTMKGYVKDPQIALRLYVDGSEIVGNDAQSEAVTYLLFGRFKSELTPSERSTVSSSLGTSVGSLYASAYFSKSIREILPFIVDAQFTYTQDNPQNTDVELVSDIGDARVKYGGKLLKDVKNFEIVVDYPLNKLMDLNLPETLLFEFAREEKEQIHSTSNTNNYMTTEVKILYKMKF